MLEILLSFEQLSTYSRNLGLSGSWYNTSTKIGIGLGKKMSTKMFPILGQKLELWL